MKVKLRNGWPGTYAELTVGNVYRVLGIEADLLRIISDAGDPILFHANAFDFVDSKHPEDWIAERGEGGELYAYPAELREPRCFFETWHDGDLEVRKRLHWYVHDLCYRERAAAPGPPNSYLRAEWKHESPDDPITLYGELDEERWEVRKVELFRDGRVTHAWGKGSTGTTQLGGKAVASFVEIAADPEFTVAEIDRAEFEAIWDKALESDDP